MTLSRGCALFAHEYAFNAVFATGVALTREDLTATADKDRPTVAKRAPALAPHPPHRRLSSPTFQLKAHRASVRPTWRERHAPRRRPFQPQSQRLHRHADC
jgi:hypothetical protein